MWQAFEVSKVFIRRIVKRKKAMATRTALVTTISGGDKMANNDEGC